MPFFMVPNPWSLVPIAATREGHGRRGKAGAGRGSGCGGGSRLTGRDGASGGVDVHGDVGLGVDAVEVEHLRDHEVRHVVVHGAAEADDPLRPPHAGVSSRGKPQTNRPEG